MQHLHPCVPVKTKDSRIGQVDYHIYRESLRRCQYIEDKTTEVELAGCLELERVSCVCVYMNCNLEDEDKDTVSEEKWWI